MDTFNPNQMPPIQSQMEGSKSRGPLISVIIILALIIIGGLYFLRERSAQEAYMPTIDQTTNTTQTQQSQSQSDDLKSIEADLKATNLDNLDDGASVIQAELQ